MSATDDQRHHDAEQAEPRVGSAGPGGGDGPPPESTPAAEGEAAVEAGEVSAPDGGDGDQAVRLQAERDEYLAALQRLKAEFDNYRRRAERDRQSAAQGRLRDVLGSLLPVVDNLERAMGALAGQDEAVVAGIEMVRGQLVGVLGGHGVTEIAAAEAHFDPNVHEAIAQVQVPGRAAGEIVEVVEKGYLHEEAVLRPARVVVAADGAEG